MFLMNGNGLELINADHVQRFAAIQKDDACIVIASYRSDTLPTTIARYQTANEAKEALERLFGAISRDEKFFYMPMSTGTYKPDERPRNGHNGNKKKGHGGS